MDIQRPERPKFEFSKVFKSYIPLLSFAITAAGFILLNQELTALSAVIILFVIIVLAHVIYSLIYLSRYIKYLLKTERNHNRLMHLYGEKESELVEKDRVISSYPEQLIMTSSVGFIKGMSAVENRLSPKLADLNNKDIDILEKSAGSRDVELTFDVGTNDGIGKNTLLSIVTKHGDDLWGVVRIIWVNENKSRGEVFTKINGEFWRKMEKEMYSDAAPPQNVKARLYDVKDFRYEKKLIEDKLERKG